MSNKPTVLWIIVPIVIYSINLKSLFITIIQCPFYEISFSFWPSPFFTYRDSSIFIVLV